MNAFVLLCLIFVASRRRCRYSSDCSQREEAPPRLAATTTRAATTAAATTAASVASTVRCRCHQHFSSCSSGMAISFQDPWCYTSPLGSPANSGICWPCKVYADCNWQAPCINSGTAQNAQHVGNDTIGPTGCASSKPY
ncbi:hypothetical protein BV898_07233 [Hypsibius exemplaris]|uniref:Secreted protein n=1 Tax=Hypsibius exemplaris TaxID=2072580 RepID=A0A1W0WUG6_HYPEX|nr:hypothetical protein BV898_07233 [Hypsibius exemplaris]